MSLFSPGKNVGRRIITLDEADVLKRMFRDVDFYVDGVFVEVYGNKYYIVTRMTDKSELSSGGEIRVRVICISQIIESTIRYRFFRIAEI